MLVLVSFKAAARAGAGQKDPELRSRRTSASDGGIVLLRMSYIEPRGVILGVTMPDYLHVTMGTIIKMGSP
jgi:hypothetical protein